MFSLVDFPVSLPRGKIPVDTDAVAVATSFSQNFESLGPELFTKDAIWRDIFAFTGTLRIFYSGSSILAAWNETSRIIQPGFVFLTAKVC
jgi:hypothetical protein